VPKRKLIPDTAEKPKHPTKWSAFAPRDSKALEAAFQKTITNPIEPVPTIPVNEDHLFEVDIAQRELSPVYFRGSTYEVRRAGWFFQDGSVLRPCDENLATQIEEGYIKLKPFRSQATTTTKTPSTEEKDKEEEKIATDKPNRLMLGPQQKPKDTKEGVDAKVVPPPRTISPFRFPLPRSSTPTTPIETAKKEMIWKLLGEQHMGKYVVYTNATTAWLLSDDLYGKLTSSVYQTLSAGVHLGGAKLVRGYVEQSKSKAQDKVSDLKATNVIAKGTGDESVMDAAADQAEEKEMEQDYDSEKEDPTRYASLDESDVDKLIT
jgi:hypothetical protein